MSADHEIVSVAVYPGIGIARVGNSRAEDGYFIGPELPYPVTRPEGFYRDRHGALKRQAARFRLYGFNAKGEVVKEITAEDGKIEWTVEVANKKAAWYNFNTAMDIPQAVPVTRRNASYTGKERDRLEITPGPRSIEGCDEHGERYRLKGEFLDHEVYLGELRTDHRGRLLFLGGHTGVTRAASGWRVRLRTTFGGSSTAGARWLVDATGRAARLARQLGATPVAEPEDRLVAFAALYRPRPDAPEDLDTLTLVESEADGWWYTARLPRRRRAVAFFTDHDLDCVPAIRCGSGFDARLGRTLHVCRRIEDGGYRRAGEVAGGPASSCRMAPPCGDGWLAVGDAAVAFDPLSSQGIFTALYSGLRGARAVAAELSGAEGRVAQLGGELLDVYRAYLRHRASFYAQERRFAQRDFWRRRMAHATRTS